MPDNKKQHYVPKFYLKNFSVNKDDTNIGLYNKSNNKFIEKVPLKNQAYQDYFYGKDLEVEKEITSIENAFSQILREIIEREDIPPSNIQAHKILYLYTFLQSARTLEVVNNVHEMLNVTAKEIFKNDEKFKDLVNEAELKISDPAVLNIKNTLSHIQDVMDLELKLIVNRTSIPFITSDHPVIKYNQFMEYRKYPYGTLGLITKGLQFFFPLTPHLQLFFFDKDVYKVGNRNNRVIETCDRNDIIQLNKLQIINSSKLIFFNESISEALLRKSQEEVIKQIQREKNSFKAVDEQENDDGTKSVLMHFIRIDARINLNLSFIKQTKKAKKYIFSEYVSQLRNENLRFL